MLRKRLIQRHKTLARVLLYATPLLIAGALWAMVASSRRGVDIGIDSSWLTEDYESIEVVQLFQEYLRIDTSFPGGNEIPAAEFLARHFEAEGIPVWIERIGERNANLWAILEGEDPAALVLHNHFDVDPLYDLDRWTHPPFGGVIEPPWIYGRGAFDMKSLTIAQLQAMLDLKRSGARLERSVIFLATGDEESGDSQLGAQWFIQQHPDLVDRFWGLLTEGGAVEAITLEDVRYWGTEFCQKRFIEVYVCDARADRLQGLRQDLLTLSDWLARPQIPDPIRDFLKIYGATRGFEDFRAMMQAPESLLEDGASVFLPPRLKSSVRNELAPFPVVESPDGDHRLRVILHLMPGESLEGIWSEMRLDELLSGFTYTLDESHADGGCSDPEHPLFRGIDAFMKEHHPQWEHGPLLVPKSATDARFFRVAGVPSYGYSPFLILSTDSTKMTGPNERMPLPPFIEGVERYQDLVRHLVSR